MFLNPPYGTSGLQGKFLEKALFEYRKENVGEVICLTKAVPGYFWYDKMFHVHWLGDICTTYDRLSFYRPEWVNAGKIKYPKNSKSKTASTFWYLGPNYRLFEEVFSKMGMVINVMQEYIVEYVS